MLAVAGGSGMPVRTRDICHFLEALARDEDQLVVRWGYQMSDLGLILIGIPVGLLLIAGMVGTLFLFVH